MKYIASVTDSLVIHYKLYRVHSYEVAELFKYKECDDSVRSYTHPVRDEALVEPKRSL